MVGFDPIAKLSTQDNVNVVICGDAMIELPKDRLALRKQRLFMMNQIDGWMGGGMWGWIVIYSLVFVVIFVVVSKLSKK